MEIRSINLYRVVSLKVCMLTGFTSITFIYCMILLLINAFLPILTTNYNLKSVFADDLVDYKLVNFTANQIAHDSSYNTFSLKATLPQFNEGFAMFQEMVELTYIVALLAIFRPRIWPANFENSLLEGS